MPRGGLATFDLTHNLVTDACCDPVFRAGGATG